MAECSGAPGQDGLGARDGFHACRGSPLAQAAAGAAPRFGVRDTASGPPASQPGPGRRQRRGGAGGSRGGERAGPGAEPAGPPPAAAALTPTTAGAAAGSGPSPRRRRGRGVLHPPPCPPPSSPSSSSSSPSPGLAAPPAPRKRGFDGPATQPGGKSETCGWVRGVPVCVLGGGGGGKFRQIASGGLLRAAPEDAARAALADGAASRSGKAPSGGCSVPGARLDALPVRGGWCCSRGGGEARSWSTSPDTLEPLLDPRHSRAESQQRAG